MAYNLRSKLTSTSEGSSVVRSEGMNLSPVQLAVPMSQQTQTTAGHGLDLLGPAVIEGNPEALQTAAMPAPTISQSINETDVSLEVVDLETDGQTETLNATMVSTPAANLAADSTHPTSSVCGAGAAGLAQSAATAKDLPTYRDHASSSSSDPSHACSHVCHWLITIAFLKFVNPFLSLECAKVEIQI